MNAFLTEYDEEKVLADIGQERYEDGKTEGKIEGKTEAILELLEEFGVVPDDLKSAIWAEKDLDVLKKWHKLAAKAKSVEEFRLRM